MRKEIKKFIKELDNLDKYSMLKIVYDKYVILNNIGEETTIDDIIDIIEDLIREYELIGDNNSIECLSDRDPSLNKSLDLASKYGYKINEINSEILATILMRNIMYKELYSMPYKYKRVK